MTARALFLLLAACGAREPAHVEVVAAPSSSAASLVGAHQVAPPRPQVGTMTVNGRLPPEMIQHVLEPIVPRARACSSNSTDDAFAAVHFVIGRQGEMLSVKVDSSNVPDAVAACITAIFESLSFPAPEGGIVTVVYPLFFHTP